jgi:hypothetical protein
LYTLLLRKANDHVRKPPYPFYERRKKSRHDVNAGEGSSRIPQPGTSTKRIVHRDFPWGRMHIDIEIEEVEEDHIETSDDESADDKTYMMSPMQASENSAKEDEDNGSEERHESAAKEEEGMVEGTLNPRSHGRDPFDPSPTIRIPHKSLRYVVTIYKWKGATKRVKKLWKVDPRSQQKDASDYRFHTHFQEGIYETVIMDRWKIVSEAQWIDWRHMEAQQDPIYDQVIAACENHHLKILMGIHYDWNVEVIA